MTMLAASLPLGCAGKDMVDPNSKIRHSINTRPMELNVDVKETYNNKFMALMESACRPEPDGYFGATFGQPLTIHYAFKLETEPLANVLTLLDVVEDKVVDVILQNAFPQVCGFRRRRLAYAASGVRFLPLEQKGTFLLSWMDYFHTFDSFISTGSSHR